MKKIIGFLLACAILCGLLGAAPIFAEGQNGPASETLGLLQALGIVQSEYDEVNFNADAPVTRADFAIYAVNLLGENASGQATLWYNDVPRSHYAFNEITYLTERGLLRGIGDKTFMPDEIMEQEDAVGVLLNILGYGEGTYNGTVYKAASDAGILDGVGRKDELLLGDLCSMLYNTLLADCMEMELSGGNVIYKKGSAFLYNSRKMVYARNKFVSCVNGADFFGGRHSDDIIVIDNNIYISESGDMAGYLGYNVDFVYRENDDSENEIIWIEENPSTEVLKISVDEECSYDPVSMTLTYYESNRNKRVVLSPDISVIYNGRFEQGSLDAVFGKEIYDLTLFSDGSSYKYAIVNAYTNIFVAGIDTLNMTVYDRITGENISLDPEEFETFVMTDRNGNNIELEDIANNSVISLFESSDKTKMRAVVSVENVQGKVTQSDGDGEIRVNDEYYEFYDKDMALSMQSARSVTLYLDCMGYIAYAKISFVADNQFVAYVYNAYYDIDNDCIGFKIFDENGNFETVNSGSSLYIDDVKCTNITDLVENMFTQTAIDQTAVFKPQLMLFTRNNDGVITRVYRSSDNNGTTGRLLKNNQLDSTSVYHAVARAGQGIIGTNVLYDSNTKLFNVPADSEVRSAARAKFSVGAPVADARYPGAVTYKVTTDKVFYEQYILYKAAVQPNISETAPFFVIDRVIEAVNEDDEIVRQAVGWLGGTEATYDLNFDYDMDPGIAAAKKGDIYLIATNDDNEIVNNRRVYQNTQGNTVLDYYGAEANNYGEARSRYYIGYVTDKDDTALIINRLYDGNSYEQVANLKSGADRIIICDSNEKRLYKGSAGDVTIGSLIIVNTTYNANISIVVYK